VHKTVPLARASESSHKGRQLVTGAAAGQQQNGPSGRGRNVRRGKKGRVEKGI